MTIATKAAYDTRHDNPSQTERFTKAQPATGVVARPFALWSGVGEPAAGSAPSTAVVPTRTTTGALGQQDSGASTLRMLHFIADWATPIGGTLTVADRLSHQGGLSGTTVGAQTTNLPTAALTRYTSGAGVLGSLDVYTVIGSTGTTATASYTNELGVSAQTSQAIVAGGTGFREAGQILWLTLAVGDVGMQAVASVSLVATTGTVGNFGITLRYPLVSFPASRSWSDQVERGLDALMDLGGNMPGLVSDACLELIQHTNSATPGVLIGEIWFGED